MKPDYKNWMPKGMVCGFLGGTIPALVVTLIISCTGLISQADRVFFSAYGFSAWYDCLVLAALQGV